MIGILFVAIPSYAAGPMMHVALGEIWLAQKAPHYTEEQKRLFLLGTVFPDIRYLGTIQRDKTHYKNVTLTRVQRETKPFQQGMLFHSFVDEYRQNWNRQRHIEKQLTDIPAHRRDTFLKLIEDQILYPQFSWVSFRQSLMSIPSEEKTQGVEETTITEWHTALALYFTVAPSGLLLQLGLFEQDLFNIKSEEIKKWGVLLPHYAKQPAMQNHVTDMMAAFKHAIVRAS